MIESPHAAEIRRIQIEPTNRCNFRCGYCRRSHWSRPTGDMSLGAFTTLLARIPTVARIHLQGVGEPLLNKAFPEMIRMIRARGMQVGTTTNGSMLTREMSGRILGAGINRINLSLDTIDPGEFRRVRPGSPLKRVLAHIASLAEVRSAGGFTDCALAVAVVAEQSTVGDLPKVVELASSLGLDEVYVQNLNGEFLPADYVESEACAKAGLDLYRQATQAAEALAARLGIRLLAPALDRPDPEARCGWPRHGCNITWDGFVAPCCLQPDPDVLSFGNVFETEFDAIWRGPAYEAFRRQARMGQASICAECPDARGQMWHPEAAPL